MHVVGHFMQLSPSWWDEGGMEMLASIRCMFVSESTCAPQSPLLHHNVSSLEGTSLPHCSV